MDVYAGMEHRDTEFISEEGESARSESFDFVSLRSISSFPETAFTLTPPAEIL